jgi:S1-C subfamily serine protease
MLDQVGVKRGDMIYEIDGYRIDIYGEMRVPWFEDKVSIIDYVSRLSIGQDIQLVAYREGKRKEFTLKFNQSTPPSIRRFYPGYEEIDYFVFGGMVLMDLTLNHIQIMGGKVTGLTRYAELQNQSSQAVVITHVFPTSQLARSRTLTPGTTIAEINGIPVKNLTEVRQAVKKGAQGKYLTIKGIDNLARASDNILVVLPLDKIYQEESQLAADYHYIPSDMVKDLLLSYKASKALQDSKVAVVQ